MDDHPPEIPMPQALDIQDREETLSNISPQSSAPAGELMNRRQLGKGRTEHNRLDVPLLSTIGKSGNGTR
jgi:hypothetical protein